MSDNKEAKKADYGAGNITALEGLEAVRKRPGMYIGSTDSKGLHHLVWEVVDNSIDEHLAGHCSRIEVIIEENNSITVTDNGRGIPVGMHAKLQKSALEVVMTVLHAGGKNALSEHLHVKVKREGKLFEQEYKIGKPQYPVREIGTSDTNGTIVTFMPDKEIFEATVYKYDTLAARLKELSYLNSGLELSLTDKREKVEDGSFRHEEFYSEGGLAEFVAYLDESKTKLIEKPIHVIGKEDNVVSTHGKVVHTYLVTAVP